jgi:hypothetical protein
MDLMKSLEFVSIDDAIKQDKKELELEKKEAISDLDNALNLINVGRKLNGLPELESLIKDTEEQITKSIAVPSHVLDKTEFIPILEKSAITKENLSDLINGIIDSKVIENKEVKVIHSNKAITDYNKKVNRIKKRDSKPTEADLQRIEQAQKERQAKREKNLVKAGK